MKNAVDAAVDGADPEAAARCDAGTLDPEKAEGFAIICVRGTLFSANAAQVQQVPSQTCGRSIWSGTISFGQILQAT